MKHYPTKDAAKLIGRCERQVQRYCEQGLIGQKVGRNWIIGEDEIKAFVLPPHGRPVSIDSTHRD